MLVKAKILWIVVELFICFSFYCSLTLAQTDIASFKWNKEKLNNLARGYMSSRIFLTAIELDLFNTLGTRMLTVSELAKKLNTNKRATEILLNALVGLGLLEKKENKFSNIKEVANLLIPSSPHYCGGGFGHTADLWQPWSYLTMVVRTGQPFVKEWTEEVKLNFALAMRQHGKEEAHRLAKRLDCKGVRFMLDLGGGPGSYAIAFSKTYPYLKAVVFDQDEQALRIAREDIIKERLEDRIHLKKGDFLKDDIGHDYDLVLLSSIIHAFGEEENIYLLSKVKKSLKDGGQVVIKDFILDESKTKPVSAATFAINMLVNTKNGRTYSFSEVKGWLNALGFKEIYNIALNRSKLIIGKK